MAGRGVTVKKIGCHSGEPGCWLRCGLLAYVDERTGKLLKVTGNPEHPTSKGYACGERISHMVDFIYHPEQLKYPLKRVGERGSGQWRRIPWEQALDEIASKLKELIESYGPECIGVVEGTYRTDLYWARARFLFAIGNPGNVAAPGTICACNDIALQHCVYGTCTQYPDIAHARCIVVDGRNYPTAAPLHWHIIKERKKRGEKVHLVVLDPRCTETAKNADYWLQLRPGTDAGVFLAWLYIMLRDDLYDRRFVERWSNGPLLLRTDKDWWLTERDIVKGGKDSRYVAWDKTRNSPVIWDPITQQFYELSGGAIIDGEVNVELEGHFELETVEGQTVKCKTAFTAFKERIWKYPPERMAKVTWVSKELLEESARLFATTKPGCVYRGVSSDQLGRAASSVEIARAMLRILSGNLDVVGGDVMTQPGPVVGGKMFLKDSLLDYQDHVKPEVKKKMLGADMFPIMAWPMFDLVKPHYRRVWKVNPCASSHMLGVTWPLLARAIITGKPYPIKGLIIWTGNPAVWAPNTKLVYEALSSLNLELTVVIERWLTPSCTFADYVLPAATKSLERPYVGNFEDFSPNVNVWERAIKPLGERKDEYWIFRELARRLLPKDEWMEAFPWESLEEADNARLAPIGLTLEKAKDLYVISSWTPKGYEQIDSDTGRPRGFATPTGRAEIWVTIFKQLGRDPMPFYVEPWESPLAQPELAKDYPLILNTGGRFRPQFHSELRQWGMGMRERHPDPLVEMHPETAKELGISEGDWVWIETKRGKILMKAKISEAIHPKCVNAEASWWYPELPGDRYWWYGNFISNANVLTLDDLETLDVYTGSWQNRALLCKVYRATGFVPFMQFPAG
ncbi:MAG: molybdopterin-dependent oxidoreductase [Nitrososphaerota archaeon]|nr:molybdopterin-dependent oxidoreductase [Candidatus Bathyarchaeota archaeon]MDW8022884.1 molybdopterin-dependent oxidoreductase [Nitrososphaerota archaeon]